ncbi:MAG: energy transducer TonB [Polaribacter sp.]
MNSKFKISIPKPCHENWTKMTPKEKGRFCSSCSKTVIDFTKKSTTEIQNYLVENKNEQVCGHFYKKQLDAIVIEIPQTTFQQQLSFQKLFVLALFFVMGSTLFSCQYSDGKKQKIENVIIKDSIKTTEEDLGLVFPTHKTTNSVKKEETPFILSGKIEPPTNILTTDGIIICETIQKKDSIIDIDSLEEITIEGDIDFTEVGEVVIEEEDLVMGMIIEEPPRFKESKKLSTQEAKKDFDKRIQKFVDDNFDINTTINLGLRKGKHRIYTQFVIDKKGFATDIKVRAPHPKLEKEVRKMFEKLPKFIPGKQRNKTVKTSYNLPIIFVIE